MWSLQVIRVFGTAREVEETGRADYIKECIIKNYNIMDFQN